MAIDNSLGFKTNFVLTFSRIPSTQFFIQDLIIPAVNLSDALVATPRLDFNIPGDKLSFDPLTVSFLIDENFKNYYEIYNWFMKLRSPVAGDGLNEQTDADLSDATLIIMNNNKIPIAKVTFIDCYPSSLDGALFDVAAEATDPQLGNLTLSYSYYEMELLPSNPSF